jgi:hypothetical protein
MCVKPVGNAVVNSAERIRYRKKGGFHKGAVHSNGNLKPVKCQKTACGAILSMFTCSESRNEIHEIGPFHANTRSTAIVCKKLMNSLRLTLALGFLSVICPVLAGTEAELLQPAPSPSEEKNSTEIFNYETVYTGKSDFKEYRGVFGDGDSLYNDFSYAHRFLITGNWYLRVGAEYERFDFGGTDNGLPDHLQTIHALLAYEYIVHDHAGAGIEIDPGPYFENDVTGDSIDVPWKVWVTFPLKKDKIFAVIGAGGSIYSNPIVAPGGGLIWLFTDHLRLEGVFPKPALVYNPSEDWEFRLAGNLFYESYRTDDVITPARKLQVHNAIVQYSEDRVGVQATYSHFKPFDITLDAGCMVRRYFDFFRAEAGVKTDPAPYVRLAIEAKF